MMSQSGAALIAAERRRQIEEEDWSPEHDDTHDHAQLCTAAGCYVEAARKLTLGAPMSWILEVPLEWPWHDSWWKPAPTADRNLIKAGALIAAELDRLHRRATR